MGKMLPASGRTVLLTGGSGSVGMNVCQALLAEGDHVVLTARHALDPAEETELRRGNGKLTVFCCDVLDQRSIQEAISQHGVTDIIHAAAVTPGAESDIVQARNTMEINCVGTISVLDAALAQNFSGRFLLLGSISAYGESALRNDILIEGETAADPHVIYEISKFAAERIFLRYRETAHLDGCVVRIGDVYGPWEHYSGVRPHMSLPYQAAALAVSGKKAFYARDYSGEWIYGPDLARAVAGLLRAERLRYDVYPVSSGLRWKISEWCALLRERFPAFAYKQVSEDALVNMRVNQPTDNGAMSLQRLQEDTAFAPAYDLQRSFAHYMDWLDAHPGYLK